MPSPNTTAFQRPDLGLFFEEIDVEAVKAGMIGLQVMPIFSVSLQTASFSKIPIEAYVIDRETARASGSGYNRQTWEFEQDSYFCEEHGAEEVLDDREAAIYAYTIDFERVNAFRAMIAVMRNRERRIADATFSAANRTAFGASVTNEWDDFANADPEGDVKAAITAFELARGMKPNSLILNAQVMRNLTQCDAIIDKLKYSGIDDPKNVNAATLAALFDVDKVIIGNSFRSTADMGQAAALSRIWSNEYVGLAKLPTSNDLREPCFARTMHWTGDGSSENGTVEMYREEKVRSDVIRVRQDTHEKVLYSTLLYLLDNITT